MDFRGLNRDGTFSTELFSSYQSSEKSWQNDLNEFIPSIKIKQKGDPDITSHSVRFSCFLHN